MKITKLLRKVPYLAALKLWAQKPLENAAYKQLITTLHLHGERTKQLAAALEQFNRPLIRADSEWAEKIESERARLLAREDLLIDGTLGEGGLYDKNQTIKQACKVSKSPRPALSLYYLVRAIRPVRVLELGTNVGISSAYLASALKENGQGNLVTCDASPYRQRLAREMHSRLGLDNISYVKGLFTETLTPTIKEMGGIDMAFIDGHHQYQPTLDYFSEIYESSEPYAMFVFDDIRWSDGMMQAWKDLQRDPRLAIVIDLTSVGIAIGKAPEEQKFISRRARLF